MKKKPKNIILGIIAGAFIVGIFYYVILPIVMVINALPDSNKVELNKFSTNEFLNEIVEYGKIYELDDCKRHTKVINGVFIRMSINESENEHGEYYKNVLQNQNIELETFEKFRKFLETSNLRSFYKSEKYSIFIVDGFMDSSWGYLFNHTGKEINEEYLSINGYYIELTENLKDDWYKIRAD